MTANIQIIQQPKSWQNSMAHAVRDPIELLKLLDLDSVINRNKLHFPDNFKMLVPLSFVGKMKKGDWNDSLLRQVLPLSDETVETLGYVSDPVGDLQAVVSNGVLQKYQGRVLLITTGACAVHCRYCFRREFPYASSTPDKKHWQSTIEQLTHDKTIREVIFSGGDPLMLPDERLRELCNDIVAIPHIHTIRFHTRLPIILPERINTGFLHWFTQLNIQKVVVVHANHANEIDGETGEALESLVDNKITVLNQSVLLKDVNDDVKSLCNLSQRLLNFRVMPYYIHLLDKVRGAAHFDVPEEEAIQLIKALKLELPGYLVPKLVKEVSGKRCKQSIE